MCELFAMSSNAPATVSYSLEEFSRHGGLTGPHKDGWGIAYYVQGDVRLVKEPLPASDSACLRFIQDRPFSSALVISHIRKATQGVRTLTNCQPFVRELGGAMHVFAHNGNLDTQRWREQPAGCHRPVGDTDSEHAFCVLLGRLAPLWLRADRVPPLDERVSVVAAFAQEMRELGPANFLYADGEVLFAHGHKRMHGGHSVRPPGLHVICRRCARQMAAVDTAGIAIVSAGGEQHVTLVASVPLTPEPGWRALGEGELLVIRDGAVVR
ncbi:MAG: class II glutamine amidotransferase [Burkholderiales bacterium]